MKHPKLSHGNNCACHQNPPLPRTAHNVYGTAPKMIVDLLNTYTAGGGGCGRIATA